MQDRITIGWGLQVTPAFAKLLVMCRLLSREKICKHKWRVPLMYNSKSHFNPTECVKCGKMIANINDYLNGTYVLQLKAVRIIN